MSELPDLYDPILELNKLLGEAAKDYREKQLQWLARFMFGSLKNSADERDSSPHPNGEGGVPIPKRGEP